MTLNPITALPEQFQKLINEHGSATILRDHLAMFKDQVLLLEKENTQLRTQNTMLTSKVDVLQEKIDQLTKDNEKLRSIIEKYQEPHDTLLDKEKVDILLFLNPRHDESMTYHIAQSLNVSEDVAEYHLVELRKHKFIRQGLPIVRGQKTWVIEPKGKKYLIENKLIS